MRKITEVVAALIWNGTKFMICQRPENKARGMLWEFVGGKVEPGETKQQALIRECREELAITVKVGEVFTSVVHEYPDLTIRLTLFHASIAEGTPQMLEHNDIRWITPEEIPRYEFCPADVEIMEKIAEQYKMPYQESICQGGILHFNTALKKRRGVNPSWLQNSTVQGTCQGCRKARRSRFLDACPA